MTTNSSAAGNLYQARKGPNSNTITPETHNLEEMLHYGKNAPVPTILRPVVGIKFEIILFCASNLTISQFKHLICSLCSIVDKILAHVI